MASIFQTKIRHVQLTWSPFSSEQMAQIGSVWLEGTLSRVRRAVDATDAPAKPLKERYARMKLRRGRAPVRDWQYRTATGVTLSAAKVKVASENQVSIGFITAQANMIVAIQNRQCKMWGVSPTDQQTVETAIRSMLSQKVRNQIQKVA